MADILTFQGVDGAFAVGLSWRHEDVEPSAKALRARAAEYGNATWSAVIETGAGMIQAGFCEPIDGVKSPKKVHPLAAIVAEAHPQPWMGIYRIGENSYWYIAVRDGQEVLPDGDQVGSFEELRSIRERHLTYGEWTEVEGTLEDLVEIVQTAPRGEALRDVTVNPWHLWIGLAVPLVLVAMGVYAYHLQQEHKLEMERQARIARQRAIEAALIAERNAKAAILPWTREPMPSDVIGACAGAWRTQTLTRAGWTLVKWRCSASQMESISVDTDWVRTGGVAADAPGVLQKDAEAATDSHSIAIAFPPPSPQADSEKNLERMVWTMVQQHGLALKWLAAAPPKPPLPGTTQETPPPQDPWVASGVEFTFQIAPWLQHVSEALDAVPGLRIAGMSVDMQKSGWSLEGKLYSLRGISAPKPVAPPQAQPGKAAP